MLQDIETNRGEITFILVRSRLYLYDTIIEMRLVGFRLDFSEEWRVGPIRESIGGTNKLYRH